MQKRAALYAFFATLCASAIAAFANMQAVRADGYAFAPPPGWRAMARPGHGVGLWQHPDSESFHQNISVIAERYNGSLDAYTQGGIRSLRGLFPDIELGHVQHATVCGSHPSTYLNYAATARGRLLLYEQMATIYNGVAYVATYTRLNGQPSLREARTALTSLCGGLPAVGGPAMRSAAPPPSARATATAIPATQYTTPAPVGSVAPTITPRP